MLTSEYSRAISLLESGNAHEATTVLTQIVERYPRYAAAQVALAKAISAAGEPQDALLQWSRAEAIVHGSESVRTGLRLAAARVFVGVAESSHPGPQSGIPEDAVDANLTEESLLSPQEHAVTDKDRNVEVGRHDEPEWEDEPRWEDGAAVSGLEASFSLEGLSSSLEGLSSSLDEPGASLEDSDSGLKDSASAFEGFPGLEDSVSSHPGLRSGIHPSDAPAHVGDPGRADADAAEKSASSEAGPHESDLQPEWQEQPSGATHAAGDEKSQAPEWETSGPEGGDGSDADFDVTLDPSADDVELDRLIDELETARIVPRPDLDAIPEPDLSTDIEDVVSETLARIYATQKQFGEAARVYERLALENPDRADEFEGKAAEMRQRQ